MSFEFNFRQTVFGELAQIHYWYESQRSGLGDDFFIGVDNSFEIIELTPYIYPIIHSNIRRAPIKRFPYKIYYKVEDFSISELSIFHNSRDFNAWKKLH